MSAKREAKAQGRADVSNPFSWLPTAALLFIVTFVVYLPALKAGFIWDDNDMLFENHLIQARDGLKRIWFSTEFVDYFPLTMSSLWMEWRLWGMNATGYHFTNILLHGGTAVLLWRILSALAIPGAFWAALIFAVHPVNVESVAWITERKNTLSLFFYAASVLCFLESERSRASSYQRVKEAAGRWYFLSLGAFALSLLAKTATVMLPVVLLGLMWWQNRRITREHIQRSVPFFGLALVMALITIWFQYNRAITETVVNENTFLQRLTGAGWAVWFYLWKALVPWKLTFVYPKWEIDAGNVLAYFPGIAVLGVLAAAWKFRERWGRPVLLGFGYFMVTLFPVLGFFNIYFQRYSFVADHWQYVAIIGIIALAVAAVIHFLQSKAKPILIAVVAVLALLSFQQTKIYKNQETLWRDTLSKNPRCAMAEGNWGLYLANQNPPQLDEAMRHYEAGLAIKPDDEGTLYNSGVALLQLKQPAAAIERFEKTLEIDPNHKLALMSLAWLRSISRDPLMRRGEDAVRLARRGVELTKERDEWQLDTLAAAYAEAGQFEEAVKTETQAIQVAQENGANDVIDEMRSRLRLYQSGTPFHEQ
jgi:tetratricopeptide (TPR) repeat protein